MLRGLRCHGKAYRAATGSERGNCRRIAGARASGDCGTREHVLAEEYVSATGQYSLFYIIEGKITEMHQSLPRPKRRSASGTSTPTPDSGSEGGHAIVDPDSELAQALQPLLEQEALLESFVEEARTHRKFEDVQTLKGNLGEIRAEIDKIVGRAEANANANAGR